MEYYSAIERNRLLMYVTTWVDLEIILLSDICQPQKDKCYMITLR